MLHKWYATSQPLSIMTLVTPLLLSQGLTWTTPAQAADKPPRAIRYCVACHTFNKGEAPKIGPNLYGIYGAAAANNPDFSKYGTSMKDAAAKGLVWTEDKLDPYMQNPVKFLKAETGQKKVKTSMITRVRKAKDRRAIIEYLKTLTD